MGCNASKEVKDKEGDAPYTPAKGEKAVEGGEHGEEIVKSSSANTQSAAPPKPERSPDKTGENGHVQKGNLSPDSKGPGDYSSLDRSATLRRDKERAKLEFFGIDPETKQKKQRSPEPDFSMLDRKLGMASQQSPHKLYDPPMDKDGYVKDAAQQIQKKAEESDDEEPPASPPAWIGEREKGGTGNVKEKVVYMENVKEGKIDTSLRLSHSPSPRLSFKSEEDGDEIALKGNDISKVEGNHMAEYGKGLLENVHREDVQQIIDREHGKGKEEDQVEEGGVDPAQQGALQEDRFYNNKAFEKPDVDPSDPQQQDAALTIQTKYRQFNAKKVVSEKKEEQAAVKIQAGFRGYQDRQRVKKMKSGEPEEQHAGEDDAEEEVDIDLDDPEVAEAASKIQAGFKGYKARKEVQAMKAEKAGEQDIPASNTDQDEEEIDIDLNDPEVEKAATKIQAGFKGYKTRKEMTSKTSTSQADEDKPIEPEAAAQLDSKPDMESEIDIDLTDPEVEKAATKIQAGFKGFKTRKEAKIAKDSVDPTSEEAVVQVSAPDHAEIQESGTEQVNAQGSQSDEPVTTEPAESANKDSEPGTVEPDTEGKDGTEEEGEDKQSPSVETEVPEGQTPPETVLEAPDQTEDNQGLESGVDSQPPQQEQETVHKEEPQDVNNTEQTEDADKDEAPEETKEEENIDIDLNDPEVEKAASKIQAGFKGMKTRQELAATKAAGEAEPEAEPAAAQEGEPSAEEGKETIDIDLNDPEVEKAATKIQAGFKGMKTRQEVAAKKENSPEKEDKPEGEEVKAEESKAEGEETKAQVGGEGEEIDIDLNDPEVEKAATKIQAGFKGMKTRKGLKDSKEGSAEPEGAPAVEEGQGPAEDGTPQDNEEEPKAE